MLVIESFPSCAMRGPDGSFDGLPWRSVAVAASDPLILAGIHRPEANLAIWNRDRASLPTDQSLRPFLRAAPFTAITEGAPDTIIDGLVSSLPSQPPPHLLLDIADLAAAFAIVDGARPTVRVRLEALVHDGCYRWHADAVGLRLLCTYCGAGTEWLPIDGGAAAARCIGKHGPPCPPAQLARGAVAILKGEGYAGNSGGGCIHRSPPAGNSPRLLLCIDQTEWSLSE